MVAVKNPTYVGKGPGIPTTPVPSYKSSAPADPYYPKGSMGLAADDTDAEAEAAPTPTPPAPPKAAKPQPPDPVPEPSLPNVFDTPTEENPQ